jgi:hypothetical protein
MVFVRSMFLRKADAPLTVQVPAPGADRPAWTRVAVIAGIGFVVGVAWPRLAGVRLGPSVPESASAAASAAPVEIVPALSGGAPSAPSAPTPAAAAVLAPVPSASVAPSVNLTVGHGVVFACKSASGDSLKAGECGSLPGLDGIVMPRLRKVADCPEAANNPGKLHVVVHIDFGRGGVGVDLGRGNGVSSADALLSCAKTAMQGAVMSGVPHENSRYSVAYSLTFADGSGGATPQASASARGAGDTSGDGSAQIVWDVAIVRDAPKTGKVVAHLPHGSTVRLGAAKEGWFPVKYGDGFANDGWVYRGAVGK